MKIIKSCGTFFLGLISVLVVEGYAEIPPELVMKLKPSVVNIETVVHVPLNIETTGRFLGTGFVVDDTRGLIVTNRHVAGTSPSRYKVIFHNGVSAEAHLRHYDTTHDFAFLEIDPRALPFPLEEVVFGDSFKLTEQDEVFMIGNNDAQEYSVKFGRVSNLILNSGDRHSATIQTTFDRAGGSSGSPVFDKAGKVVAIHFAGTETTSFELRIEYIKDALAQLKSQGRVVRGECGLDLDLVSIDDAQKHYHVTSDTADKVRALRENIKHMICVDGVIPESSAKRSGLQAGDIIFAINGTSIGDNLYLVDQLVDQALRDKKDIVLRIIRNGRNIEVSLPVEDAESQKVRSLVLFAGGVFQESTPELRRNLNIDGAGVFLTYADRGSSMYGLGHPFKPKSDENFFILVFEIDGKPTPTLKDFIAVVSRLPDGYTTYMLVEDKFAAGSAKRAVSVTLDLKYHPLRVFDWSQQRLDWVPRTLN